MRKCHLNHPAGIREPPSPRRNTGIRAHIVTAPRLCQPLSRTHDRVPHRTLGPVRDAVDSP